MKQKYRNATQRKNTIIRLAVQYSGHIPCIETRKWLFNIRLEFFFFREFEYVNRISRILVNLLVELQYFK